jgi:small subunit ribosomal protein S15
MKAMEKKATLIAEYRQHATDTGSVELQIALLTDDINRLNEHFKINPHDFGSKRGLLVKVGRRRSFLQYLERNNNSKYKELIVRLGLRK